MQPPTDGVMSVAVQQSHDAVWVYIELSEVTKHVLEDSDALKTVVDEFMMDRSEQLAADIAFYKKLYKDDTEKRQEAIRDSTKALTAPLPIYLRDLLRNPYGHRIKNTVEAVAYVDHLKKVVLPKVKAAIEGHLRPKTETFQL
jgi:hypothetical protein